MLNIPLDGGKTVLGRWQTPPYGEDSQLSDESIGAGALLVYERLFKYFNFVVNFGYRFADDAIFHR